MATGSFIIGKDCKIREVILHLKSSESFHLFHDKFTEFALELDTCREVTKKLKGDYRMDKVKLTDVVHDLIEEWVSRNGSNATLQEIIRALNEIGLNGCSELLKEKLIVVEDQSATAIAKAKKYDRLPPSIEGFLIGTSKFCIVRSLDCEITCEKLAGNWDKCIFHEWNEFVCVTSIPRRHDETTVDIVKNCTIKNLKQLNKIRAETHAKVVFVTTESEQSVKEVMDSLSSRKDKVEICADTMDWQDLTWTFQCKLTGQLEELYQVDVGEMELNGSLLADMINRKEVKLFKDTLPKELSYYVERRVLTRCFISSKVFEQCDPQCSDIFLFTGMVRHELSRKSKETLTDTSTNQIRHLNLSVRYMTLEQPSHFEKIFDRACGPVHLLHYENGKLRWLKSRRGMGRIQECIDESQVEHNEEEFCKLVSAKTAQNICISDGPGMGKSVILAELGRKLERIHPERMVFFVVISELVNQVKEMGTTDMNKATELALKFLICGNIIGEIILSSKLGRQTSKNEILVELLLDGFDEVGSADENLAYDILQTINKSYKSLRMWTTSRPHFLHKLENHLGILGYNIQPFKEEDQIQFLTCYWCRQDSANAPAKRHFAQCCLSSLKNKLNPKDEDIAGVPLQCLLIGEVYEDDALEYAETDEGISKPVYIDIGTITNLYEQLIKTKFKKYINLHGGEDFDERATMEMHVRLSLELIFPENLPKLEHMLGHANLETLLNIGLVESTDAMSFRFIHRTFAEYLIAWFVMDRLVREDGWNECLSQFLVHDVLREVGGEIPFNRYGVMLARHVTQGKTFKRLLNQVTNYFIDSIIAHKIQTVPAKTIQCILGKLSGSEATMKAIVYGCALDDFLNLMAFFNEIKVFDIHTHAIICQEFIILTMENSGLRLIQLVLRYFDDPQTFPLHIKVFILRAAVRRGEYSTLEFFIKGKGFREILENPKGPAQLVLHDCVKSTDNNSESAIVERIHIMNVLVGINRDLLETRDENKSTPLLAYKVHTRLLLELIHLGANVFAEDPENGHTILDNLDFMSDKNSYNFLCKHIPEDDLQKLLRIKPKQAETQIMSDVLVQEMDPLPETISLLRELGADFKSCNLNLAAAIIEGRPVDTLRTLIKHGSSVNWQKGDGGTLLHLAAEYGKVDAIKFLIEEHNMEVNAKTRTGHTPMDCLIKGRVSSGRRFEAGFFLARNGGKFKEATNSEGESLLHLVAKDGNTESVRLLLHLKAKINAVDRRGNTPLHCAMGHPVTQLLLDNNANPNAENGLEETPLHVALKNRFPNFSTLQLLKAKMDMRWSASIAYLWFLAILKEDLPRITDKFNTFAQECATAGVTLDWNYRNPCGETLLHLAVVRCNFRAARFLNKDLSVVLQAKTVLEQTGVQRIMLTELKNIITFLIRKGVNGLAKDNQNHTYLHICIRDLGYCKKFLILELLEYLVEIDYCSIFEVQGGVDGSTPLQLAIRWGILADERMLKLLQERGVDFNILDKNGRNVLSYAILGNQKTETVSSLIDCGTAWRLTDCNGCNLLHISAQAGNVDSLKFLLALGELEVNKVAKDGSTPLHYAAQSKKYVEELCRLLVENGADTNVQNRDGDTPMALALKIWWHASDHELPRILGSPQIPELENQ